MPHVMLCVMLLAAAGDGFVGRWDLTVTSGSNQHPSWLEVSRADGKLTGRFVGRSGGVRPVEVQLEGDELRFAPEPPRYGKADVKPESYRARLVNGKLVGEGADSRGNAVRWEGVRAPDRKASASQPRWGAPVTLFNGRDLAGWTFINPKGRDCWSVVDGALVNAPPCVAILTERRFRDFKLHIEFNVDRESNSGVYLRGRYEVQIADHHGREQLDGHGAGALYSFLVPSVNAARPAGEWQTYEITLIGYRVTIVYNGRTIIDNKEIDGITGEALDSDEGAPGPILLQGNHGRVRFRNIVLTPAL